MTTCRRRRRGLLGAKRRGGKRGTLEGGGSAGGFIRERGALIRSALAASGASTSSSTTQSPQQRSNGGSGTDKFSVSYLSPLVIGAAGTEVGKTVSKGGNVYNSVSTSDALERVVFVGSNRLSCDDDVIDEGSSRMRPRRIDSLMADRAGSLFTSHDGRTM